MAPTSDDANYPVATAGWHYGRRLTVGTYDAAGGDLAFLRQTAVRTGDTELVAAIDGYTA